LGLNFTVFCLGYFLLTWYYIGWFWTGFFPIGLFHGFSLGFSPWERRGNGLGRFRAGHWFAPFWGLFGCAKFCGFGSQGSGISTGAPFASPLFFGELAPRVLNWSTSTRGKLLVPHLAYQRFFSRIGPPHGFPENMNPFFEGYWFFSTKGPCIIVGHLRKSAYLVGL